MEIYESMDKIRTNNWTDIDCYIQVVHLIYTDCCLLVLVLKFLDSLTIFTSTPLAIIHMKPSLGVLVDPKTGKNLLRSAIVQSLIFRHLCIWLIQTLPNKDNTRDSFSHPGW